MVGDGVLVSWMLIGNKLIDKQSLEFDLFLYGSVEAIVTVNLVPSDLCNFAWVTS
jgi:hypothetical protein